MPNDDDTRAGQDPPGTGASAVPGIWEKAAGLQFRFDPSFHLDAHVGELTVPVLPHSDHGSRPDPGLAPPPPLLAPPPPVLPVPLSGAPSGFHWDGHGHLAADPGLVPPAAPPGTPGPFHLDPPASGPFQLDPHLAELKVPGHHDGSLDGHGGGHH